MFKIDSPGKYRLRNGEAVEIVANRCADFPWATPDGLRRFAVDGRYFRNRPGPHRLDVVERVQPDPFKIDSPGAYRLRNGEVVGIVPNTGGEDFLTYPWKDAKGGLSWTSDGKFSYGRSNPHRLDVVERADRIALDPTWAPPSIPAPRDEFAEAVFVALVGRYGGIDPGSLAATARRLVAAFRASGAV